MSDLAKPEVRLSLTLIPGLIVTTFLSGLAWAISLWIGVPTIISALLIGLCFSPFVGRLPKTTTGIDFATHTLMKVAVACLGASVNMALLIALGWPVLVAITLLIVITIGSGFWLGRWLGRTSRFAILSAGAVAICGSSAAMALCCALPPTKTRQRDLSAVIIGVSLLSALGVLLYPFLTQYLELSDVQSGFVLGGSLHNVAQAIAAGFLVSDTAGETATLVKMMRVSLLAPCVMLVALAFRSETTPKVRNRWGLLPPIFLIVFLLLMIASSAGWIPEPLRFGLDWISRAGLILAMTAIGLSTPVKALLQMDGRVIVLMGLQTLIILAGALLSLPFLSL